MAKAVPISRAAQEPTDEPCPWPGIYDGACRQHVIHPDEFSCSRCDGSKLPDIPRAPAKNAKVAEWIDWAVKTGASEDYARTLARDELIAEFGDRPAQAPAEERGEVTVAPSEVVGGVAVRTGGVS